MQTNTRNLLSLKNVRWREAAVLLVVAWLVPFLVHMAPWAGVRPLGVYLLPVFWTAFVAVYFYGVAVGLAVGLITPAVNLVFTGLPLPMYIGLMALEVFLFVLFAAGTLSRWPNFRLAAPLAYLVAKAVAIGLQWTIPAFDYHRDPVDHWLTSLQNGLAGLGVLLAVNLLLVAYYPKTDPWEQE